MASTQNINNLPTFITTVGKEELFLEQSPAIRHNSITQHRSSHFGSIAFNIISGIDKTKVFRPSEISSNKNRIVPNSPEQLSIFDAGIHQISSFQDTISQISSIQDNSIHHSTSQISTSQINFSHHPNHNGTNQTGITQINLFQKVNPSQISSHQINPTQIKPFKRVITSFDSNKGEIPFSQIITSDQLFHGNFFSTTNHSHNSNLQVINQLNNSVNNIWSTLLPQTDIDITYEIKDLPTGQLAEATITGFDSQGKPNAGIISIDHNANGLGWFIDETPFENAEFGMQNAEWAFEATPDSPAYSKYDLLTTLLHETAHLYGFINGYSEFDKNIRYQNGRRTFVGDNFTAFLSPDGSHLDSIAHPNDLLNTHLAPGVRKLPSDINVLILNAIQNTPHVSP